MFFFANKFAAFAALFVAVAQQQDVDAISFLKSQAHLQQLQQQQQQKAGTRVNVIPDLHVSPAREIAELAFPSNAEPSGIAVLNGTHLLVVGDSAQLYVVPQTPILETADRVIDGVTYTVKHKVVEDLTLQKL